LTHRHDGEYHHFMRGRIRAVKAVRCGAILILSVLTSLSCRKERTYAVEVRDGVRHVHNIKPASEKPVAGLAFVGKIGEIESTDPDRQFASPMSADEDAAGNLFILDDKEFCVKKFGADRKLRGRFGRKGQGPGEFEYPMTVKVSASGQVIVSTMSSDFHVFDNDGVYIDRFRLLPYRGISPAVLGSDRIVAYAFQADGENSRANPVLAVFDFHGLVQLEFGEPSLLDTARKTWNANFFSLAVDGDENIFVAFSSLNRIEKYSPTGRLLLSIDRVLPYEIVHGYEKSSMEIRGRTIAVDQPAFTPVNRGIGTDSRGRIWVLSFQKEVRGLPIPKDYHIQDYVAFEVYSPAGELLSRIPFPPEIVKFDNFTMRGDHLFFVDPFDEACVYEYAVVDHDD
jgi:hypothetical protein